MSVLLKNISSGIGRGFADMHLGDMDLSQSRSKLLCVTCLSFGADYRNLFLQNVGAGETYCFSLSSELELLKRLDSVLKFSIPRTSI